jgi:hypothetical protein
VSVAVDCGADDNADVETHYPTGQVYNDEIDDDLMDELRTFWVRRADLFRDEPGEGEAEHWARVVEVPPS